MSQFLLFFLIYLSMEEKYVYPQKVLLAWGESIKGNKKITDWLMKNGFAELAIFSVALRNDEKARAWLAAKGFKHLLAVIEGSEGKTHAVEWLGKNKFKALAMLAAAGDGQERGFKWLKENRQLELIYVAQQIRLFNQDIEDKNNDHHTIDF